MPFAVPPRQSSGAWDLKALARRAKAEDQLENAARRRLFFYCCVLTLEIFIWNLVCHRWIRGGYEGMLAT